MSRPSASEPASASDDDSSRWRLDDRFVDAEDEERNLANTQLANRIKTLQNPADCRTARFIVAKHWSINCGLGADMHVMSVALHVALMLNRTLLIDDSDWWWFQPGSASLRSSFGVQCDPSAVSCLFSPVSRCTLDDIPQASRSNAVMFHGDSRVGGVYRYSDDAGDDDGNDGLDPWRSQSEQVLLLEKAQPYYCNHLHPSFSDMGELWYRSKLMQFLLKLTQKSQAKFTDFRRGLGLEGEYISVHVRRGDNYENPNHAFTKYQEAIAILLRKYSSIGTVFLASDDQDAVDDARRMGWVTLDNPRRYRGAVVSQHGTSNDGTRYYDLPRDFAESWDFFPAAFELLLLSRGRHLAASLGSNYGRLAFELMHARDPLAEAVTLDVAYSYFK